MAELSSVFSWCGGDLFAPVQVILPRETRIQPIALETIPSGMWWFIIPSSLTLYFLSLSYLYLLTFFFPTWSQQRCITSSMEQSPSWEANLFSASREIPAFYVTRSFICRIHISPPCIQLHLSRPCKMTNRATHFCYSLSRPRGHSAAGSMSLKYSNDTIGNRTRELTACTAVPEPTPPPRAPTGWQVPVHTAVTAPHSNEQRKIDSVFSSYHDRIVLEVAHVPTPTFAVMVTRVYLLLRSRERARSLQFCGHFLFCFQNFCFHRRRGI
jgi:hypothetical protein